jgi:hypothetical protein
MGLFDWFRKPKTTVPLPQLCYDIAYFILPHYAFKDLAKLTDLCLNRPAAAGPFFYVMAAQARKAEPDPEDANRFRWHHGQWNGGHEYFALEYPVPPPVDMSDVSIEQMIGGGTKFVLAPHFSAIIGGAGSAAQYFILGQAPMGGGTTLRCILPEGMNCNLGPGPEPQLSAFLDAIRERIAGQAEPGAAGNGGGT